MAEPGQLDATLVPPSGSANGLHEALLGIGTPTSPDGTVTGYELLGELGRGGMGVVYKARCRALHRMVALKMVLAGAHAGAGDLARFKAEAEVVAQLQHPNIVQIFEIGQQSGRPYLALELVSGGNLQQKIAGTPQPVRASAHLIELLARAIHFAHQQKVIHRDLKPGNVLLAVPLDGASASGDADAAAVASLYGVPKVTDFGLAKRSEGDSGNTVRGEILGTPSYMAPEQAGGRADEAGPAADVYALGAMLYEMLTGRPPFKGATSFETIQQVLNEEPVPPGRLRPRLPKDLERICLKCLEKDPRRRYATALDLAADLRRMLNGEAVHVRSAPPHERLWRWARRNPVPACLLLAISLGSAVGFWQLSALSRSLVRSTALESAVQQSDMMNEVNRYYGRVASHLMKADVEGKTDWASHKGAMPPPATMTIELAKEISDRREDGVKVRLYSEYPFKNRLDRPPPDKFETEALAQLRRDPKTPHYSFEEMDGRPVLRYATARVMDTGCADCHNLPKHRQSDWPVWKEGDVRGVLEIIRPLDGDRDRIDRGMRGTVLLVAGSAAGLAGLSAFLMFLGNRRRRVATGVASDAQSMPPRPAAHVHAAKADPAGTELPLTLAAPAPPPLPPRKPKEPTVVWQSEVVVGSLMPVRFLVPDSGTLRFSLVAPANPRVELQVEVSGSPAVAGRPNPYLQVSVAVESRVVLRVRNSDTDGNHSVLVELIG